MQLTVTHYAEWQHPDVDEWRIKILGYTGYVTEMHGGGYLWKVHHWSPITGPSELDWSTTHEYGEVEPVMRLVENVIREHYERG